MKVGDRIDDQDWPRSAGPSRDRRSGALAARRWQGRLAIALRASLGYPSASRVARSTAQPRPRCSLASSRLDSARGAPRCALSFRPARIPSTDLVPIASLLRLARWVMVSGAGSRATCGVSPPNFWMLSRQDASNACNPATTSFELEGVQPIGPPCIVRLAASILRLHATGASPQPLKDLT